MELLQMFSMQSFIAPFLYLCLAPIILWRLGSLVRATVFCVVQICLLLLTRILPLNLLGVWLFIKRMLNRGDYMKYEIEGYTEENPVDEIWVMDGRGKLVKLEVEDDAGDD